MQRRTSADHMFEQLHQLYMPRLYHTAIYLLGNRAEAEDAAGRAFTAAFLELSASRRHASSLRFACGTHSSHMVQTKLCLYKARVRWSFYKTCRSLIFKSARQLYSPVCMGVPCGNWRISSACRSGLSLPGWKARSANYAACGHTLSSPADKMRNILHIISEKFF